MPAASRSARRPGRRRGQRVSVTDRHPDRPQEEHAEQRRWIAMFGRSVISGASAPGCVAGTGWHPARLGPGVDRGRATAPAGRAGSPGRGRRPRARSWSRSPAVSMPSAISWQPLFLAKYTMPATSAWRTSSWSISCTSPMSSFTKSGRSSRMCRKLAKPAPASSTAIRTSAPTLSHRGADGLVVLDGDVLGHLEHHGRARLRRQCASGRPPAAGRARR